MWTRITPNTDTFHAAIFPAILHRLNFAYDKLGDISCGSYFVKSQKIQCSENHALNIIRVEINPVKVDGEISEAV